MLRALERGRYFGLQRRQVAVVAPPADGTSAPLPPTLLFDSSLRATFSGATRLARRPGPAPGDLPALLAASGALARMRRSGVRLVEVNAVDDNLLWRPADAAFLGAMLRARAAAAAKVAEPAALPAALAGLRAAAAAAARGAGYPEAADAVVAAATRRAAPAIGVYCFALGALERLAARVEARPLAGRRLVPAARVPKRTAPLPPPPVLPARLPAGVRAQALAAVERAAEAAAALTVAVEGYALRADLADLLRCACGAAGDAGGDGVAAGGGAAGSWLDAGGEQDGGAGGGALLVAVDAAAEFAPVWAHGACWAPASPRAAARQLLKLHAGWVTAAGGVVACDKGGDGDASDDASGAGGGVEVSPLVSSNGEGLAHVCAGGRVFAAPLDPALQAAARAPGRPRHNAGRWFAPLALAYVGALAVLAVRRFGGGDGNRGGGGGSEDNGNGAGRAVAAAAARGLRGARGAAGAAGSGVASGLGAARSAAGPKLAGAGRAAGRQLQKAGPGLRRAQRAAGSQASRARRGLGPALQRARRGAATQLGRLGRQLQRLRPQQQRQASAVDGGGATGGERQPAAAVRASSPPPPAAAPATPQQ